jgi:hypothetical protein
MVERDALARPGGCRHYHVVGRFELGQISTGTEGRWLSRTDDDTLDVTVAEPTAKDGEFGDGGVGENIHRTAGHVENEMQDVVYAAFGPELLQLSQRVHGFPLHRPFLPYSIPYICVLV